MYVRTEQPQKNRKGKKMANTRSTRRKREPIPAEVAEHLRATVDGFGYPALEHETRGGFCYLYYAGKPLSRLGYRGEMVEWDFTIYKYTIGKYSNAGYLIPDRASLDRCISISLGFYNLT